MDKETLYTATSTSAGGNEREEVVPLIKKISRWKNPVISSGKTPMLEADKRYDALSL
jgi:hypothetical protein